MFDLVRTLEVTGKTTDDAVAQGLAKLELPIEEVEVRVLEEPKGGLLGFGARAARVQLIERPQPEEMALRALRAVTEGMGYEIEIENRSKAGHILFDLAGPDIGGLIGKHGQTLDALQYVVNLIVSRRAERHVPVEVDASGYRESRAIALEDLATRLARRVLETGRAQELEPMSSQERKVIHLSLKDHPDVYTFSAGEDPYRRVVVAIRPEEDEEGGDAEAPAPEPTAYATASRRGHAHAAVSHEDTAVDEGSYDEAAPVEEAPPVPAKPARRGTASGGTTSRAPHAASASAAHGDATSGARSSTPRASSAGRAAQGSANRKPQGRSTEAKGPAGAASSTPRRRPPARPRD